MTSKYKRIAGWGILVSVIVAPLVILPTVTHSWNEAIQGYSMAFIAFGVIALGVHLIASE